MALKLINPLQPNWAASWCAERKTIHTGQLIADGERKEGRQSVLCYTCLWALWEEGKETICTVLHLHVGIVGKRKGDSLYCATRACGHCGEKGRETICTVQHVRVGIVGKRKGDNLYCATCACGLCGEKGRETICTVLHLHVGILGKRKGDNLYCATRACGHCMKKEGRQSVLCYTCMWALWEEGGETISTVLQVHVGIVGKRKGDNLYCATRACGHCGKKEGR